MYFGCSKEFLEAGKCRLAGDTARAATSGDVKGLRRVAAALKEVVFDLTLENRLLKKKHERGWGGRGMRYPASEKADIINLVEQSHLPAKRTLELPAGQGLESHPRRRPRPDHRPGAGAAGAVSAGAARAVHRRAEVLRVGSVSLWPAEGP